MNVFGPISLLLLTCMSVLGDLSDLCNRPKFYECFVKAPIKDLFQNANSRMYNCRDYRELLKCVPKAGPLCPEYSQILRLTRFANKRDCSALFPVCDLETARGCLQTYQSNKANGNMTCSKNLRFVHCLRKPLLECDDRSIFEEFDSELSEAFTALNETTCSP